MLRKFMLSMTPVEMIDDYVENKRFAEILPFVIACKTAQLTIAMVMRWTIKRTQFLF